MNNNKTSNPVRLIAFFLTAAILTLTFGFTVDGWMFFPEEIITPNKPNIDQNGKTEDTIVDNKPKEESPTPEIIIPEFINRLTGLETTEDISKTTPFAFVMNGSEDLYGISRSDLLIEITIENDNTRLISFISDTNDLWKIGSIAGGRGYINNISKYFGAIAVYNGNDDIIQYEYCNPGKTSLDLSLKEGYLYTEFSNKIYTNYQLIESGKSAYGISDIEAKEESLPFTFNSFENSNIKFENIALRIEAKLSEKSILQLVYNEENGKYSYTKNGIPITDSLNGTSLDFTNCLVLFADSVTYDNSNGCELVMNTVGSGIGYYITEGSFTEIKWNATISGSLSFYLPSGEKLTINRGNSYICYLKSSIINNILFS